MANFFFDFINVYWLLTGVIALLWYYSQSTYNYWRKLNVNYLKPIPFFGNTASFVLRKKTFHETIDLLYQELKNEPYGGIYEMRDPTLLIKDPALVTAILVANFRNFHDRSTSLLLNRNKTLNPLNEHLFFSEGERWRILRQKMRPFFSPIKMKQMYDQIFHCVNLLTECIDAQVDSGSADVAVKLLVDRMTIDVIGTCAFGIDCHSLKFNDKFVKMCKAFFKPIPFQSAIRVAVSVFGKPLVSLLNLRNTKKEVSDFFVNLVLDTMQYRRQNNIVRNDLLQLLMNLQNSYIDSKFAVQDMNQKVLTTENFDEIDIAANTFLSFVAGYETTSATLSLCLYEIALNQDIQQKLRSEIQRNHDKYETISYDSFKEMPYLDAVIYETLRKYPAAVTFYRQCTEDYIMPGTKVRIPAGTKVMIPVWSIHHDSNYYPNPEVFDPERFMGNNKQSRPNGVYLPFGDGPRLCLGKFLGETELKTALSVIMLKYDLKPCSKTEIPLTFRKGTSFLLTQHGVWLNLSKRKFDINHKDQM